MRSGDVRRLSRVVLESRRVDMGVVLRIYVVERVEGRRIINQEGEVR